MTKAEIATEKRFESMNEFRQQLSDQARTFMPRAESESQHTALNDKLIAMENSFITRINGLSVELKAQTASIEKILTEKSNANSTRLTTIEGKGQGAGQMISWIAVIVSIVGGAVAIALHFVK